MVRGVKNCKSIKKITPEHKLNTLNTQKYASEIEPKRPTQKVHHRIEQYGDQIRSKLLNHKNIVSLQYSEFDIMQML